MCSSALEYVVLRHIKLFDIYIKFIGILILLLIKREIVAKIMQRDNDSKCLKKKGNQVTEQCKLPQGQLDHKS